MMPIVLPPPTSAQRNRILNTQALRCEALDRLYERRYALNDLIRSLENYQKSKPIRRAELLEFVSADRKCS